MYNGLTCIVAGCCKYRPKPNRNQRFSAHQILLADSRSHRIARVWSRRRGTAEAGAELRKEGIPSARRSATASLAGTAARRTPPRSRNTQYSFSQKVSVSPAGTQSLLQFDKVLLYATLFSPNMCLLHAANAVLSNS